MFLSLPQSDVEWSLLCVQRMRPGNPSQTVLTPLEEPPSHSLLLGFDRAPGWHHSWIEQIPYIGRYLWLWFRQAWSYNTTYESVAAILAKMLGAESDALGGKTIAYIERSKVKLR
jgi:hypothetical protein